MPEIYLRRGDGTPQGPYLLEETRFRFERGELAGSTMSWCGGERRWQSLARRWPMHRTRGTLSLLFLGLACTSLAVLAVLVAAEWLPGLPHAVRSFWPSTAISMGALLLAATLAVRAWKISARRAGRPGLGAVLCVVLVVAGAMCSLPLVGVNKRLHDERVASDDASMTFDRRSGELRIAGSIGDRFVPDLRAALARHAPVRAVAIDSPGGFVEDAFEAGRIVRALGVPVRVRGECASACVIVWASAAVRQASVGARFGLHPSYTEGEVPDVWRVYATETSNARTVSLLREVGFDEALLARREKAGPGGMYWIDGFDLHAAGVRLALVDATGSRLSPPSARVLRALAEVPETRRVVEARARLGTGMIDEVGPGLYQAWRDHDSKRLFAATAELVAEAESHALAHAPDAAVIAWARRMHALFDEPVHGSDRLACAVLADGAQAVRKRDDLLRGKAHAALADLLASVPPRRTVASPTPAGSGGPPGYDGWPSDRKCAYLHSEFAKASRSAAADAARDIRAVARARPAASR